MKSLYSLKTEYKLHALRKRKEKKKEEVKDTILNTNI